MKRVSKLALLLKRSVRNASMMARVIRRRATRLGAGALLGRTMPPRVPVVYLDAGLHRSATQLKLVQDWLGSCTALRQYGFEAHPTYATEVKGAFASCPTVDIVNVAIVGPGQGDHVRLHLDGKGGAGDSLIKLGTGQAIDVPAVRLSRFLSDAGVDPAKSVLILRMNIEGAELFVLEDLLDAGVLELFDGFYGSWDDPLKIGGETARRFLQIRDAAHVENLAFNDKDCLSPSRLAAIRYDLTTSILYGARRKALEPAATV